MTIVIIVVICRDCRAQTREVTEKFTVEVEMDRRCYEELLDERKNMELTYEERIAQLQDQHSEVCVFPFYK